MKINNRLGRGHRRFRVFLDILNWTEMVAYISSEVAAAECVDMQKTGVGADIIYWRRQ